MSGKKIFSTIDLKQGYNQLKIKKSARRFFSFTWNKRQYQFRGAPFGVHFLPSKFHRLISHLLSDLDGVTVYIDDICIASEDMEAHKKLVAEVLKRLNNANLKINEDKCVFGNQKVKFLGFVISQNGVCVDPERRKKLLNVPLPTTGNDIRSFLGGINFIRDYLPYFGEIAGCLYDLVNLGKKPLKNNKIWVEQGIDAFKSLIELLNSPAVLQHPLENVPFELCTDAGKHGFGGCLFQNDPTSPKVYALRHLKWYLKGATFNLFTDNHSLSYMYTHQLDKSVIGQWFDVLADYSFTITHVRRENNQIADIMSKMCIDTVIKRWRSNTNTNIEIDTKVNKNGNKKNSDLLNNLLTNDNRTKGTSDWKLNSDFFNIAEHKYGPHTIDLFAADHNCQLPRYMSKSNSAFRIDWSQENGWCNPPWHLIDHVLDYVKTTKSEITLCIPLYFNASWFQKWKSMLKEEPTVLPRYKNTFLREGKHVVGETPWKYTVISRIAHDANFQISDSFWANIDSKIEQTIVDYDLVDKYKDPLKNCNEESNYKRAAINSDNFCVSEFVDDSSENQHLYSSNKRVKFADECNKDCLQSESSLVDTPVHNHATVYKNKAMSLISNINQPQFGKDVLPAPS
eukprot:Awhi_evm1s3944